MLPPLTPAEPAAVGAAPLTFPLRELLEGRISGFQAQLLRVPAALSSIRSSVASTSRENRVRELSSRHRTIATRAVGRAAFDHVVDQALGHLLDGMLYQHVGQRRGWRVVELFEQRDCGRVRANAKRVVVRATYRAAGGFCSSGIPPKWR
jgi:hypothetical protein